MIPVLQPSVTEAEVESVAAVLRSRWWGEGSIVAEFERRMAERYGVKHCVAVNSCTAALHLALKAHGIGPGDEVIVPALTFVSTALAVVYCGARPLFADVHESNLCLDWTDAKSCRSVVTKAIVPVDYAGYVAHEPYGMTPAIIQDAAHSCGGVAYGDCVCLSFHPVKNLATGDGGAVLTNDDAIAKRIRALRWCGIDRSTWQRSGRRYSWDYDIAEAGYKCHWNDIQAAIGLAQLERLDVMNARRREIARRYAEALGDVCQTPPDHPQHTWHLYPIRVDAERRDGLLDYLAENGVSAGVHYKPLTYYPMFGDQPTPPVTEREWRRLVSLPIYADLLSQDQDWVIRKVREWLS